MKTPYDAVMHLIRTEKGTELLPLNKYTFLVNINANKFQIRSAIEKIYKVKVAKVNTTIKYGKTKRVRYKTGKTADWKKAIVTLRPGQKIEIS